MEHAYFSPSASSRWLKCPASLFLTEGHLQETSAYAHEGIVCHDIAANILKNQDAMASDYAGKIVEGVSMTPELINAMQMYVDEIRGLAKEYKASGGKIEHKVELTKDCWGTSDAFLWNKDTLLVCDLKMGKGIVVSADDNPQLKLYSVGALKWLMDNYQLKPIRIINIIIQPRTPDPIRKYEINRDELASWYVEDVVPILRLHKKGEKSASPCNPGEVQCRWCPVSATCAAQANKIVNDAQTAFSPFTKAPTPSPELNDEGELTIEETVNYKKLFKHIQNWMNTVDEFLMAKALDGNGIPDFKLVEGRSNRQWKADENYVANFLRQLNTEPYMKKLVSPSQAEKVLGKKLAQEHKLDNLITKPPGAPTLVPQSDKRPEMQLNVEPKFEEFIPVTKVDTETVLVDAPGDEEEIHELTALQRMRLAEIDDEPVSEVVPQVDDLSSTAKEIPALQEAGDMAVETASKTLIETATGGDLECVVKINGNGDPKPPANTTKRHQVFDFGKGGVTLKDAANILGCGVNMIKMHLRYLNERDGYSYKIYSNDTFKVY